MDAIAKVFSDDSGNYTANANLIAAAPEMLKELEIAQAELREHAVRWDKAGNDFYGNEAFKAANNIEQLIKKAKGEL